MRRRRRAAVDGTQRCSVSSSTPPEPRETPGGTGRGLRPRKLVILFPPENHQHPTSCVAAFAPKLRVIRDNFSVVTSARKSTGA
ncbi:unnamed protein product [Pleuronectes platessa]|uniref:Uncharacterized protein n=1 Tax=Pleuronectes platessa TaxID=8262 RepID=A0A9N7Y6N9_PLEPL|nr:unnamed protein product [Pleuronectes platessa]